MVRQGSEYGRRRGHAGKYSSWYNTPEWRAIRANQLREHPLCQGECEEKGRIEAATVCDHVEPHRGNREKFFAGPFQSLCYHCHNSVKQRIENGSPACDENGNPIDSRHHWNKKMSQVGGYVEV